MFTQFSVQWGHEVIGMLVLSVAMVVFQESLHSTGQLTPVHWKLHIHGWTEEGEEGIVTTETNT